MPRLPFSLACGDYDRTRALHAGSIQPDGLSLICHALPPEEIFFRVVRVGEFDAAELSLSSYLLTLVERTRAILGDDYWTYGVDQGNITTLRTLARYSYEQGLARRRYEPHELFAPETLERALV